ncbi:efflux RND transporter periplasmic adaptor subunit [Winogradskyella psychrotolerans]|uniref:efflux RND transporter periplasmic adaptor subunit n=1 Tax=Winogradskyella psychrotolerans TaxID=1344585 RepID=UPI001C06AA48|nr:efflux RND transporter periplasmic adaptor subunit [Winogradskyella psychrotolerans]MBU2928952.1 efflux RND transporter periplasmic adaptor subunit [Winogradskyella psychrotolerans]
MTKHFLYAMLLGLTIISCAEEKTSKSITPIAVNVLNITPNNGVDGSSEKFPGIIKPVKTATMSFQVAGDITNLPVNMGDYVKKGQLIAAIDPSLYKAQYEANKAQANLAKENFTRINNVFQKGSIAEIRMLEAKSNYEQAQSALNAASKNLNHTKLTAPFSGYISNKLMESGDVASPGMPVVELVDLSKVQAIISLSDKEVNHYKTGTKATIYVPTLDKTFSGTLTEIAIQSESRTPVYTAKITVDNPDFLLKPGMTCTNVVENTDNKATIQNFKLPVDVVSITNEGQNFVYVVNAENNTAQRKIVEIGKLYNDGIEIKNGLAIGDKVITSGYHKLTNNTPIKILTK